MRHFAMHSMCHYSQPFKFTIEHQIMQMFVNKWSVKSIYRNLFIRTFTKQFTPEGVYLLPQHSTKKLYFPCIFALLIGVLYSCHMFGHYGPCLCIQKWSTQKHNTRPRLHPTNPNIVLLFASGLNWNNNDVAKPLAKRKEKNTRTTKQTLYKYYS